MSHSFSIQVLSDVDYEDLIAEIYCGDNPQTDFVGIVSQESGFENLEIEIYPRKDGKPWMFKLVELMQAIEKAKLRLWELRKTAHDQEKE